VVTDDVLMLCRHNDLARDDMLMQSGWKNVALQNKWDGILYILPKCLRHRSGI
jgi:hypothetical protein